MHKQLKEKDEEKAATQTELDDLLMVFGDLEEKVEKYKVRCRIQCVLYRVLYIHVSQGTMTTKGVY